MFLQNQHKDNINEYYNLLKIVGSLSNLFTDSNTPYLYYRAAENIFCKAFEADNLSRSDCSADASKNSIGIGLKTFLNNNGNTLQKIAEFNRDRNDYAQLIKDPKQFINHISELRNKRLESTKVIHSIDNLVYHCVSRDRNRFLIYEEKMQLIDIKNISNIKVKNNALSFNDKLHEYSFNLSKSTLFKRFSTQNFTEIKVDILDDPYETLKEIFEKYKLEFIKDKAKIESVILPLYSSKTHEVESKSGLNQWNANGEKRKRKPDQIYIPVPADIHKLFPHFFPEITIDKTHFNLKLPNDKIVKASMCQGYCLPGTKINKGKGLMSNPNKDLGQWVLQEILKVPEGKLVTYEMLAEIGIDSVEIRKIDINNYEIDFKKLGSYEEFILQNE